VTSVTSGLIRLVGNKVSGRVSSSATCDDVGPSSVTSARSLTTDSMDARGLPLTANSLRRGLCNRTLLEVTLKRRHIGNYWRIFRGELRPLSRNAGIFCPTYAMSWRRLDQLLAVPRDLRSAPTVDRLVSTSTVVHHRRPSTSLRS
jgi:hypothetical protein